MPSEGRKLRLFDQFKYHVLAKTRGGVLYRMAIIPMTGIAHLFETEHPMSLALLVAVITSLTNHAIAY